MLTSTHKRTVVDGDLFRWFARASSAILFIAWIALVIDEAILLGAPAPGAIFQGAAFAIVFAGYAMGWRYERAGGIVTLVGMAALFAVFAQTFGELPPPILAWFAAPGVLYLLAWWYDQRHTSHPARQS